MPESCSIAVERVDRFEMFRESLTEDERADLDKYVLRVIKIMQGRGARFGKQMARELVVALVDFEAGLPGTAAPRKGGMWIKRS